MLCPHDFDLAGCSNDQSALGQIVQQDASSPCDQLVTDTHQLDRVCLSAQAQSRDKGGNGEGHLWRRVSHRGRSLQSPRVCHKALAPQERDVDRSQNLDSTASFRGEPDMGIVTRRLLFAGSKLAAPRPNDDNNR